MYIIYWLHHVVLNHGPYIPFVCFYGFYCMPSNAIVVRYYVAGTQHVTLELSLQFPVLIPLFCLVNSTVPFLFHFTFWPNSILLSDIDSILLPGLLVYYHVTNNDMVW